MAYLWAVPIFHILIYMQSHLLNSFQEVKHKEGYIRDSFSLPFPYSFCGMLCTGPSHRSIPERLLLSIITAQANGFKQYIWLPWVRLFLLPNSVRPWFKPIINFYFLIYKPRSEGKVIKGFKTNLKLSNLRKINGALFLVSKKIKKNNNKLSF